MISATLKSCAELLKSRKLTLAFAESATAGRVMADFSLAPESGTFLKGGIVCYDACIKQTLLRVNPEMIKQYSPESAEVTKAAAEGLKHSIGADIYVAITGLTRAGGSENPRKPVGTMFLHILFEKRCVAERKLFEGDEEAIVHQTVDYVAELLASNLVASF